ncbi:MAG: type VI secretion system tip protein TssI/VgrG [Wenzhouxiangella sp.]|jgi:type VI secretion system secreted protein VgrG|nr:type VI secretion system tip protein TssI/VgrG [Wenzhouxiangella sp.]
MSLPPTASQANRQASFHHSGDQQRIPADKLLLNEMFAREQVSGLFEYQLVLSSDDENIDLNELIGENAWVEMQLPGQSTPRHFCGIVADFTFSSFRDNLAEYRITLRPWLWLLTQASNNRIFENKSVPDIVKEVCRAHGFDDILDGLSGASYENRVYCVQYRESDFNFISRLMEDEGIYYYFEHSENDNKDYLVLVDDKSDHGAFRGYNQVLYYPPDEHNHREEEHLDDWTVSRAVRSGSFQLRDYDFKKPSADLKVLSDMKKPHAANNSFERYEYPGRYGEYEAQVADTRGNRLVTARLQEAQSDHELLCGRGNVRGMVPGYVFTLQQFPRTDQNRQYLILDVTHRLRLGGFDSGGVDAGDDFEYDCSLTAMPASEQYRPPRTTEKPRVYGPQTAIVVGQGQAGDEIVFEDYLQIRVKFHWYCNDFPQNQNPNQNQDSSCWVRVSQAWAGSGWGAQFVPRVGQEVVVEFLEGDPDRPIVTGSVYNASNLPPYDVPTQSGIKSRSSKGGTTSHFNEIRFEDKKDHEELYIHAERNMKIEVERDRIENVGNDETVTIGNNRHHTVDVNDTRIVEGNDRNEVTGTQHVITDGLRDVHVKNEETRTVDRSQTENVGGIWKKDVTGDIDIDSTVGNITIDAVAGNITITAANNAVVQDSNHVDISGVSWSITGTSGGITGLAMALAGSNNAVNGQALTANLVNIAFYGLDTGVTGAELKKAVFETKATVIGLKKVATELKSIASIIKNGGIDIDLTGMKLM